MTCKIQLLMDDTELPTLSQQGTPQIYFDQMNHVNAHLNNLVILWKGQKGLIPQNDPTADASMNGLEPEVVHHIHDILVNVHLMNDKTPTVNKALVDKLRRRYLVNATDWKNGKSVSGNN